MQPLPKTHSSENIDKNQLWSNGYIAGVSSLAFATAILKGAEYLCIGGCALYSSSTTVTVLAVTSAAGLVSSFVFPIDMQEKNKLKKSSAIFDPGTYM